MEQGNICKQQEERKVKIELALRNCRECMADSKAFDIMRILQWRLGTMNPASGLAYDKLTQEILVDADALMRAIQMANPGQRYRAVRVISHEDYRRRWACDPRVQESDYTSFEAKLQKEKREAQPD